MHHGAGGLHWRRLMTVTRTSPEPSSLATSMRTPHTLLRKPVRVFCRTACRLGWPGLAISAQRTEKPIIAALPQKQVIFLAVPKVASRAIKNALAEWTGDMTVADDQSAVWRRMRTLEAVRDADDAFRFAFVRNPLDRLLSCYAHKIERARTRPELPFAFEKYGGVFDPEMSFETFVERVASIPDRRADQHFASQHHFLALDSVPVVDFIGHLETMDTDWEQLRAAQGFPALKKRNHTTHAAWRDGYDAPTARLAAERYRTDIDLFGYRDEVDGLLAALST